MKSMEVLGRERERMVDVMLNRVLSSLDRSIWERLSTKQRILILLHLFGRPEQFEAYKRLGEIPLVLTQRGMAQALEKHISEVQTAIKGPYASLLDQNKIKEIPKGFIKRHDLRIRGGKYRYHLVYVLTEEGMAEAERLKNKLLREEA